jgi:hypothetical protein
MQLRVARVCLDCEEVHDAQQCPVCASESFAFLTRWVPVDERRSTRPVAPLPEPAPAPSRATARWVKTGVAGVALFAAGQWLWRATRPTDSAGQPRARKPPRESQV